MPPAYGKPYVNRVLADAAARQAGGEGALKIHVSPTVLASLAALNGHANPAAYLTALRERGVERAPTDHAVTLEVREIMERTRGAR